MTDEGNPKYTPGLKECVKKSPRIFGCEAAYWFPMDINVCDSIETPKSDGGAGAGNLVIHVRSGDAFVSPVHHGYGQVSGAWRRGMGL